MHLGQFMDQVWAPLTSTTIILYQVGVLNLSFHLVFFLDLIFSF
jgi:hypothetical protein